MSDGAWLFTHPGNTENLATIVLGSETSQSVQNTSCLKRGVGMVKPFGLVSRADVRARSAWRDRVGPKAKCVANAAVSSSAISGWDAGELTTSDALDHHPIHNRALELKHAIRSLATPEYLKLSYEYKPHRPLQESP
ncbi:amidase family protein [Pelagicoccus sp. SDUM812003]|uniref:amidase family protein n=1 Tax=Pelagicoccus sp. SDUM812003 TaxID=3041267 RepID=UPI00280F60A0|nr:amidase family protein [Pelagicoccus sp. SDUM812003]MDQ8204676.1 amidase family protein [Pelagicoccus sp. SDUM812003]